MENFDSCSGENEPSLMVSPGRLSGVTRCNFEKRSSGILEKFYNKLVIDFEKEDENDEEMS